MEENHTREFNNVVWQSMSEKGFVDETGALPKFTGPTTPSFSAPGGLIVQVSLSEKEQADSTNLVNVVNRMGNQPGFEYLQEIAKRKDVDFSVVQTAQKEWDYKQEGLTPAGAALVAIAVGMATGGTAGGIANTVAANVGSQTVGAMANAAFSSLSTQATISLIYNKGDVEATLKELGSKDSVKQLTFAMASASVSHKIDKGLVLKNIDITQTGFDQRMVKSIADSTSTSLLQTAVYGSNLKENLKTNLTMQFATVATQETFSNIVKDLDSDTLSDNIAHKIAAGLTGCLSAKAAGNDCSAGAIGATIGEMWGDWHTDNPNTLTQDEKDKLISQAKLIAAITAAYAGEDVNVAADMAAKAVRWNGVYYNKGKISEADQNKANEMTKDISSDRNAGWRFLRSKRQADLLYQLNTNKDLEVQVDVNDLGELKITGNSWESLPDGRQTIVVRPTTYNVWEVTGSLTLVRRTDGTHGVFNDTYDFEMHSSGILAIPRNIETVIGSPSCAATSGCTAYQIKFNGNFDKNKIKNIKDFQ